jgi:hypothetical protein
MVMKKIVDFYSVIELSPWRVEPNIEYEYNEQEDFERFALKVYRDAGIKSIDKIAFTPCYSINISNINDADLSIIIEKELADAEIKKIGLEIVGPFTGGIVFLCDNGEKIYHHSGYISDFKDWLVKTNRKPENWEVVWYGYPSYYARVEKDIVQIAEVIPNAFPKSEDVIAEYDYLKFKTKLNEHVKNLMTFKDRIRTILREANSKYADEIPALLVDQNYNNPNYED